MPSIITENVTGGQITTGGSTRLNSIEARVFPRCSVTRRTAEPQLIGMCYIVPTRPQSLLDHMLIAVVTVAMNLALDTIFNRQNNASAIVNTVNFGFHSSHLEFSFIYRVNMALNLGDTVVHKPDAAYSSRKLQ